MHHFYRKLEQLNEQRYEFAATFRIICVYILQSKGSAGMVDEPAHYRWSSYRSNALGQVDRLLKPHALYLSLNARQDQRETNYRALFASEVNVAQITDIRMALQQSQTLGDSRLADTIERMTGERRQVRPRGRSRRVNETGEQIEV